MMNNYIKLPNGVIKQEKIIDQLPKYDLEYIQSRYNQYGEKSVQMSFLRMGYLVGSIGKIPKSILDVGYGNGDFLKVAKRVVRDCYAYDVSNYPVPEGCVLIDNMTDRHYDVIAFFDSLEHFQAIEFVGDLKCNFLVISLPWCHYYSDDWFAAWKHRRQDEHLWHFNDQSLVNFFGEFGFELVNFTNIEDSIRKSDFDYPNILSAVFKKVK